MESRNTFLLDSTEAFMRGDLDNVTVANGRITLDRVQGAYVPYGCYTSPVIALPAFSALRPSWNADTPPETAVEVQLRVLLDGAWSPWFAFGKWSPFLPRTGAQESRRGPLHLLPDHLLLENAAADQAQLRIYLYTRAENATPAVRLLALSARVLDTVPANGRAVNARLRLIPYTVARRTELFPLLGPVLDLALCLAGVTNRWGADLLPEELALAMRDHGGGANLAFAAAAAGCFGFPAWAGWADLATLRAELRAGYGVVVALESTEAQRAAGLPAVRYAAVRGFAGGSVLLIDPWQGTADFEAECEMPVEDFLVAWLGVALFLRRCADGSPGPGRSAVSLVPAAEEPGIYRMARAGAELPLADDFCTDGILAWAVPDGTPHATTAHRLFHYVQPQAGGIRLESDPAGLRRCTVYAIQPSGALLVGDVTI